jgi:hypothetical protein
VRLGAGAQHAEITARMGFGQTHGAGPFTADQLAEINLLLFLGAVGQDRAHGTVRQPRIHAPGPVGGAYHVLHHQIDRGRQTLSAELHRRAQCGPATLDVLRIRLLETGRRQYAFGRPAAAFLITAAIQRRKHFLAEAGGFGQHRVDQIRAEFLATRQPGKQTGEIQEFIADESHIAQGGFVGQHGITSSQWLNAGIVVRNTVAGHYAGRKPRATDAGIRRSCR